MFFSLIAAPRGLTVDKLPNRVNPTVRAVDKLPNRPLDNFLAKVQEPIRPGKSGRVLFDGYSWSARSDDDSDLSSGTSVEVLCRQGNTLIVRSTSTEQKTEKKIRRDNDAINRRI